jgi:hypothetical protein
MPDDAPRADDPPAQEERFALVCEAYFCGATKVISETDDDGPLPVFRCGAPDCASHSLVRVALADIEAGVGTACS